jgi:hypothetical protein
VLLANAANTAGERGAMRLSALSKLCKIVFGWRRSAVEAAAARRAGSGSRRASRRSGGSGTSASGASGQGCGGGRGALPSIPLAHKGLAALPSPASITPLSRLEWQIAAGGSEGAQGRQNEQGSGASLSNAASSRLRVGAAQCGGLQQQQQQPLQVQACRLDQPPIWMVVAFALSTLSGVCQPP